MNLCISSQVDSLVPISAKQDSGQVLSENGVACGLNSFDSSESSNHNTHSSKTLAPFDIKGLHWSYKISARSGIAVNGIAYPLQPLVPLTKETASGLWPTPTTTPGTEVPKGWYMDGNTLKKANGDKAQLKLGIAVKLWPTPSARDAKGGYQGGRMRNGKVSTDVLDVTCQAYRPGGLLCPTNPNHQRNPLEPHQLSPEWVELLMGFPQGWTGLNN